MLLTTVQHPKGVDDGGQCSQCERPAQGLRRRPGCARHRFHHRAGRDILAAWTQWGGEDHHDSEIAGLLSPTAGEIVVEGHVCAHRSDGGQGCAWGGTPRGRHLRRSDGPREPDVPGQDVWDPRRRTPSPCREAPRSGPAHRPAESAYRQVLGRDAQTPEYRGGAAAPPTRHLPGRAHGWHRPPKPSEYPRWDQGVQQRRYDGPVYDALYGRSAGAFRPHRNH